MTKEVLLFFRVPGSPSEAPLVTNIFMYASLLSRLFFLIRLNSLFFI